MSEVKHTLGPWSVELRQEGLFVTAPDGANSRWQVCEVIGCIGYEYDGQVQNARLIAAAPDLLEALKAMTDHYISLVASGDCGFWSAEKEGQVVAARAAIAKAEGRT